MRNFILRFVSVATLTSLCSLFPCWEPRIEAGTKNNASIQCTKENAEKWLDRAEAYLKQCDPSDERKTTLDAYSLQQHALLGNQTKVEAILNGPLAENEFWLNYGRGSCLVALIIKGQSVEESLHFVESLEVTPETQKKIFLQSLVQLIDLKKYQSSEDLLAIYEKPQEFSACKKRLVKEYLKAGNLENAEKILNAIVPQKDWEEYEKNGFAKLQKMLEDAKANTEKGMPQTATNRRSPKFVGPQLWLNASLPDGTHKKRIDYLLNEADNETKAIIFQTIAAEANDPTKKQARQACLSLSLEATREMPGKVQRYANLAMLAALYEEDGQNEQANQLLNETTEYIYKREKEIKDKAKEQDDMAKLMSSLSNLVERTAIAPLVCDLYIRLGETDKAIDLAKTVDQDVLWMNLIDSSFEPLPASTIENILDQAPSPASKAAICLAVVDNITRKLYETPSEDK